MSDLEILCISRRWYTSHIGTAKNKIYKAKNENKVQMRSIFQREQMNEEWKV